MAGYTTLLLTRMMQMRLLPHSKHTLVLLEKAFKAYEVSLERLEKLE